MASVISLISSQEDGCRLPATSKQPALVLIGSGKSALQVSEEFAFQQSLGKAPQLHGYERLVARGEQM